MGNIYAPQRQTNKKQRDIGPLLHKNLLYPTCNNYRPHGLLLYCKLYIDIVKDFFQLTTQKYNQTQYFSLLKSYIYLKNTYKTT